MFDDDFGSFIPPQYACVSTMSLMRGIQVNYIEGNILQHDRYNESSRIRKNHANLITFNEEVNTFPDGSVTLKGKPMGIQVSQPCMGALRPEEMPVSALPAVRPEETQTKSPHTVLPARVLVSCKQIILYLYTLKNSRSKARFSEAAGHSEASESSLRHMQL